MLDSAHLQQVIFVNTIGLTVLCQTLKTASYVFVTSNDRGVKISPTGKTKKMAYECLAFIQGTGLELLLTRHHIDIDADKLREGFFNVVNQRRLFE